jgi:hypothetical protein
VARVILWLACCCLFSGCAAIAPFSSLLTPPSGSTPPLEIHEQTSVELAKDNFFLVKTNVLGRCRGFSLLGIITIVPATLTKAMSHLYATAEMRPGQPQSVAHLVIERTSSYYILFGVPEVDVRADIVEFRPENRGPPGPAPVGVQPKAPDRVQ